MIASHVLLVTGELPAAWDCSPDRWWVRLGSGSTAP
jgi:hypothetical protein